MIKDIIQSILAYGLSQSDIESRTGLSQATISRLLNGKHKDTSYTEGKRLESLLSELMLAKPRRHRIRRSGDDRRKGGL